MKSKAHCHRICGTEFQRQSRHQDEPPPPGFLLRQGYGGRSRRTPPAKKAAEGEIDACFSLGLFEPGEYPKGEGVVQRVKSLKTGSVPFNNLSKREASPLILWNRPL